MSGWLWLLAAGAAEIAWSQSIRPTEGFTRPVPTLICIALAFAAIWPLSRAMQTIPIGVAYAAFTGIGATGAVGLGIIVSHDPVRVSTIAAVALIVIGVMTLRFANTS